MKRGIKGGGIGQSVIIHMAMWCQWRALWVADSVELQKQTYSEVNSVESETQRPIKTGL